LSSPELETQLEAMSKSYWSAWFDKSIPMLDNQTPREAVKTKEGRERLEALLLYYENRQEDMPKNLMRPNLNELRKTLGL